MGFPLAAAGAATAGSVAGGAAANATEKLLGGGSGSGGIQFGTPGFVTQINNLLTKGMNSAIQNSTNYTNQATGQENQSLQAAIQALTQYLSSGTGAAQNYGNLGFNQSQALQAPQAQAGYQALDAYMDSLGLSRPQMRSGNLAQALFNNTNQQNQIQQLMSQYGNQIPQAATTAPTQPQAINYTDLIPQITQAQINKYFKDNTKHQAGYVNNYTGAGSNFVQHFKDPAKLTNNPNVLAAVREAIAKDTANKQNAASQAAYQTALQQYNTQNQTHQNFINSLGQIPYNPQQQQIALAYQNGLFK